MDLITTTSELASACARLEKHPVITVDTEFLRETTYYPLLCVVQMASPDEAIVIDALADGIDLKPFFELMGNETVLKVFHAARQDIEIVWHLANIVPHPIFDTQVAAMVCGFGDSVSYDQLISRTKNVHIDKSSRFTDWSRRPLSDKQLEYALADVTHLRDAYLYLKAELEREGRASWLREEMDILESRETYDIHPDDAWQRLKLRLRKPQELAILKYVAAWREPEARSRNVPRSRVLKDDAIYEIAQQQPKDAEALGRLRTIPKGWERSATGAAVLEAVNTALALPRSEMPHGGRACLIGESLETMKSLKRACDAFLVHLAGQGYALAEATENLFVEQDGGRTRQAFVDDQTDRIRSDIDNGDRGDTRKSPLGFRFNH